MISVSVRQFAHTNLFITCVALHSQAVRAFNEPSGPAGKNRKKPEQLALPSPTEEEPPPAIEPPVPGIVTDAAPFEARRETEQKDPSLAIVRMADIEREEVEWFWCPYIAIGKFTLLEGDPGIG